jgi:hypothetical protein
MIKLIWNSSSKEVQAARWIARVVGAIPCLFVAIYFSGSLEDLKIALSTGYEIEFILPILILLVSGIIGYAASWFSELYGGIIMTIIGLATGIFLYYLQGWDNSSGMFIYALPFIVAGLATLNCWFRDHNSRKNQQTELHSSQFE